MLETYRLREAGPVLPADLPRLLDGVETATIGHFDTLGMMRGTIRPVFPARVAGRAVTVAAPGRDGTIIYKAVDTLRPGDVLVIARVDGDDVACVGGGVATAVQARGACGIIIDGPCTDAAEIAGIGLPVWSVGFSARTTNRSCRIGGALNVPIACGGVAVLPGYAVLADADGIFAAEPSHMRAVAAQALERQRRSAALRPHLAAGNSIFDFTQKEPQ